MKIKNSPYEIYNKLKRIKKRLGFRTDEHVINFLISLYEIKPELRKGNRIKFAFLGPNFELHIITGIVQKVTVDHVYINVEYRDKYPYTGNTGRMFSDEELIINKQWLLKSLDEQVTELKQQVKGMHYVSTS